MSSTLRCAGTSLDDPPVLWTQLSVLPRVFAGRLGSQPAQASRCPVPAEPWDGARVQSFELEETSMRLRLHGRRLTLASIIAAVALATIAISPAAAIRYGDNDGNAHPWVGLMVAQNADGNPLWRCSGT